jgi:predicted enzyme related to lactoylglutathione lyase
MASNRFVHFEIPANDPEGLTKFYGTLFGWKVEKAPLPGWDYWVCRTGDGPGIDGGITKRMDPKQTVTNFVSVDKLEPVLSDAKALGATVSVPKSPVPGMGWFAVAIDPQGNPFGMWQDDKSAK